MLPLFLSLLYQILPAKCAVYKKFTYLFANEIKCCFVQKYKKIWQNTLKFATIRSDLILTFAHARVKI